MNNKKYHVYAIGNALVDNDYEVSDELLKELKIEKNTHKLIDLASRFHISEVLQHLECIRNCGGSAANTVVVISQLGGKCFYSCQVADDLNGKTFHDNLRSHNVVSNLDKNGLVKGHTGTSFILVSPDGQRSLRTNLGATELLSVTELDDDALAQSEFLYIEGFLAAQPSAVKAASQAHSIAKHYDVKIALSLSDIDMTTHYYRELKTLLGDGVDLLFCNEFEARSFTKQDDLYMAGKELEKFASQFVITCGENGALIYDGKSFHEIDAVKTTVVDTVGAGDVFAGTFLYGICHDLGFIKSANMASLAAARIINKFTARFTEEEFRLIRKEIMQYE